jgi:hypothetical protein
LARTAHIAAFTAPVRAAGAALYNETVQAQLLAGLLCVLLFLVVNPFLALFLVAVISFFVRVPLLFFLCSAGPTFALFFFRREYGMDWYSVASGDDVPAYISLYDANYGYTFSDLLKRFIEAPNGNEILWHAPWSFLLNGFDAGDQTFVFLHYLANFLSLIVALRLLSRRYWIALMVVYFFLTPLTVVGIAHIWRQQLAFALFLSGVALKYERRSRTGEWLIHASPFMHVSLVFFLLAYWTFLVLQRLKAFDRNLRFAMLLGMLMMIVPALSSLAVAFLDSLGVARIMSFFETGEGSTLRVYLLLLGYAVPMLGAFFWLRTDDIDRLFLVLCFAVFSIVLALPGANGIYDRLLMFSLPLMGLYFYRCLLRNFPMRWRLPALTAIFALGCYRLYLPTREHNGVMAFVADGHGLDPTMGLLRLLVGQ